MRKAWVQLVAGTTLLGVGIGVGIGIGWAGGSSPAAAVVGLPTPAPSSTPSSTHPPTPAGGPPVFSGTLLSYDTCNGLLGALRARGRATVGPYGFSGGYGPLMYEKGAAIPQAAGGAATSVSSAPSSSASAGSAHSVTTTQVAGVDEPDVVKTDGRIMVSLDGQLLHIVDVRNAHLLATLALPHAGGELLLAGNRVVVLTGGNGNGYSGGYGYSGGTTNATVVDISDPAAPKVTREWNFDSGELAARVVGGTIRLVLSTPAPQATWATPVDASAAAQAHATKVNQSIVDALPLDAWLPHWSTDAEGDPTGGTHRLSSCDAVATPATANGVGMVSVISLDPNGLAPGAGTSVFGAGDTAYAEGQHLFISDGNSPGIIRPVYAAGVSKQATISKPEVHLLEFDLSNAAQARYLAAGTIPGSLHDSYAMSEYRDRLRVTTTTYDATGVSSTGITVLARQGDRLVTVGRLAGLGNGEQVYAVRYIGDRGYVVTFRQIDPLHVVDLSDPAHPALRGTLTMPGYSSLLLPLSGHRLLGIGQSVPQFSGGSASGGCVSSNGAPCTPVDSPPIEPNGVQIALFDVSDPAHPRLLDRQVLLGAYSPATTDPHAVTLDPGGAFAVLPSSNGPVGVKIGASSLATTTAAFATPYASQSQRAVIAGGRVFELTDRGLAVRRLPSLAQISWLGF